MNQRIFSVILHFSVYYIVWFTALVTASRDEYWLGTLICLPLLVMQIAWQYHVEKTLKHVLRIVAVILVVTTVVDTVLLHLHVMTYKGNIFNNLLTPPWIMVLWVEFAIVMHALSEPMWRRYYFLGVVSLAAFPMAYTIGAKIGAVELHHGVWSLVVFGVVWAVLLPLILYDHARRCDGGVRVK